MTFFSIRTFILLSVIFCGSCSQYPHSGYKIGRDPTWSLSPFDGITEDVNAFTNAIVMDIAKEEHVTLHLINVNSANLLSALDKEEVEGVIANLPLNVENLEKYHFSAPYLLTGPVLIVRKDSQATSLEDLSNKIVGVYAYDDSIFIVQKYPSILIRTYENMGSILDALASGDIDGVVMPALAAQALIPARYSEILHIVSAPLNSRGLRLVTLKDKNKKLLLLFNQGLQKLQNSNRYLQLRAKFIF